MDLIVKVIADAGKAQERMEAAFDEAGILRILSASPPFFLLNASDYDRLVAMAALYRCKPLLVDIDEDDVPAPDESTATTAEVVAIIHRAGYTFNWDQDTRLWCVSGLRDGFTDETADAPARNRRAAAFAALRHLVS
jgi:hypothetical protein